MQSIFISHAHEDNIMTDAYAEALAQRGYDIFYDIYHLRGGDILEPRILEELKRRKRFIVFLSVNSVGKDWVKKEMEAYLSLCEQDSSRRLVAVRLTPCPIPWLGGRIYIDGVGKLFDAVVNDIVRAL